MANALLFPGYKPGLVPLPRAKPTPPADTRIASITRVAQKLGVAPVDLATIISYETGGTFSPSKWGGKGGNHLGLIQFGSAERKKYGVRSDQSFDEQMAAVGAYLQDRGVGDGSILDLYSSINAGRPGKYGASDSPGNTVRSHVENMLSGVHRSKAQKLLTSGPGEGLVDLSQPHLQVDAAGDGLSGRGSGA